ncbi:MAG: transcriptional repressor LexA [Thermoanaerobaculales bacterium]|nr:transcriptional repressor LexA [Thermoanaerobaculales bacterium]
MFYLTERQQEIFRFIEFRIQGEGVAPTLREISEKFGFSSTASAQKHVNLLIKKGLLIRDKHQKRGLTLASPDIGETQVTLPILGTVAAGSPIESFAEEGRTQVPPDMAGGENFILRVRGLSMIDDGIHDGDEVIVRRTNEARDGEMVVALVDGEVTLKRVFRRPGEMVLLQPANERFEPILEPAANVLIQGVVVGLLRRY